MAIRIIPRLDIKAPNLVKGINMEGFRVMGDPAEFAQRYFDQGADELHYQDIVASLYKRSNILDLVKKTAERIFIPLTVGGGIRTVDDIRNALRSGADKVCLNTAVVERPEFIKEAAQLFGSQCIVVAVETIRHEGRWKAFTNNGREHTGFDAYDWAMRCVEMGAGELYLTSVDREGTLRGFDLEFIQLFQGKVNVPVVAHGGCGNLQHLIEVAKLGVDGISLAKTLHYKHLDVGQVKQGLIQAGFEVRS